MWIEIDITGNITGIKGTLLVYGESTPPIGSDIFIDEVSHSIYTETYTADPSGDYNPNNWSPII